MTTGPHGLPVAGWSGASGRARSPGQDASSFEPQLDVARPKPNGPVAATEPHTRDPPGLRGLI
jgi:hypothetical protein